MYHYAQLDIEFYCNGFSTFDTDVESDYLVAISEYDKTYMHRKYDLNNRVWLDEYKEVPILPTPVPTIEEELLTLKTSQEAQDFLLDGIILDIIPSLEEQIGEMSSLTRTLNRTIQVKGGEEMAAYFAKKIMNGRSYESIFKTNVYKQYQDETDTILILEGYSHLIER